MVNHSYGSSSRKFNNAIDYPERKKYVFSKKNGRTNTFSSEKAKRSFNKQKDLKKIYRARQEKQFDNTLYSRVLIRNGRQMYDKFDNNDDYVQQYMGTTEFSDHIDFIYDLYDYYESLYEDEEGVIRQQEEMRNCQAEEDIFNEEQKKMEHKLNRALAKKKQSENENAKETNCSGSCAVHCPVKTNNIVNITLNNDYIKNWFK
jgi:hypothetical protein